VIVRDNQVLIGALRRAAGRLLDPRIVRSEDEILARIVEAAVETVPGAEGGGITVTEARSVSSTHVSGNQLHRLDEIQAELGEGPCISAADEPPADGIIMAADLAGDDAARWPNFSPRAVELGVRAILSVSLSVDSGRRSSLNLYSGTAGSFDEDAQLTAGLFGLQAAGLLFGADHIAGLDRALQSRDVIGQAKGILMERFDLTDDDAFRMLVSASQDSNIKLIEVARFLIAERGRRTPDVKP
jgi:hypothetical protein